MTAPPRDEQIPQMLTDLRFLIDALDSRVPRLERIGEAQIAHEAADLRARAVALIHRIEGVAPLV
jgi:hypothetical protein